MFKIYIDRMPNSDGATEAKKLVMVGKFFIFRHYIIFLKPLKLYLFIHSLNEILLNP